MVYYEKALTRDPDNCFPFQLEMIDVLRAAMQHDPRDAMAPLYLAFFEAAAEKPSPSSRR